MEPTFIILGALAGLGIMALGIWAAIEAEKRRKARIAAMEAFATERGLSFSPGKDRDHDEEYAHFELFRRGFDRAAYNTISGEIDTAVGRSRCKTGDFTYKTRETTTTTDSKGRRTTRTRTLTHRFSYFILDLPFDEMHDMLIRREGLFDKLASAFGKNDIDFESAEFSRNFFVRCESRRFAYAVIHPRMIEFLLETEPGLVDIERGRMCMTDGYNTWPADRFGASLDWSQRFLEHWPGFVVNDLQEGKVS